MKFVLLSVCLSFGLVFGLSAKSASAGDTILVSKISAKAAVKLVNHNEPIIIRKGEKITVKIEGNDGKPATVRLHSSLGRLVQQYTEVWDKVLIGTEKLLPGVYLVIIKKDDVREVRKVILTEK